MSRARTRLITLDSLALIITQNLQSLRDWGCARHTRTHAHRTKNFGTAADRKAAKVPQGQFAQEKREFLSISAKLCKIPINVLVHSTTANRGLSRAVSAPFLHRKRRRGCFLLTFFIFIHTSAVSAAVDPSAPLRPFSPICSSQEHFRRQNSRFCRTFGRSSACNLICLLTINFLSRFCVPGELFAACTFSSHFAQISITFFYTCTTCTGRASFERFTRICTTFFSNNRHKIKAIRVGMSDADSKVQNPAIILRPRAVRARDRGHRPRRLPPRQ